MIGRSTEDKERDGQNRKGVLLKLTRERREGRRKGPTRKGKGN